MKNGSANFVASYDTMFFRSMMDSIINPSDGIDHDDKISDLINVRIQSYCRCWINIQEA